MEDAYSKTLVSFSKDSYVHASPQHGHWEGFGIEEIYDFARGDAVSKHACVNIELLTCDANSLEGCIRGKH